MAKVFTRPVYFFSCLLAMSMLGVPAPLAATDFRAEGTNLFKGTETWTAERGSVDAASGGGWHLTGSAGQSATFKLKIPVEAGAEYFFSAEVKSADRVVFRLGGLNMSYHRQGEWQTVCGLVRSNQSETLELQVQLRSLGEDSGATAQIKKLVLQKVVRPERADSKPRDGTTTLVADGQPAAVIVYPSEGGRALGEKVRNAVLAKTGVELPLMADTAVTDKEYPVLKPEFRNKNLILLGRLATNHALWPAYNRFLAAVDGYYPGGEGFVVRTAANVFGNGRNHIILGGSSDAGVAKAVEKFGKIVAGLEGDGALALPWTLEVELGGECLKAFQADNARWQLPENPALPAMTSGYGKVVRWYENAMGYYWSGWPEYLERSRGYLKEILAERAHTHQYIVEFFIRTYDMLDESPVFTPQEITQIDSLILENFLDFLTVTDLNWMTVFSPPYSEISAVNRHQIAPWYADLLMARFLQGHVELGGKLKELVDFRLSEKDAFFRHIVANRNGPSLPGMAAGSDYEEFPAMFFRYALENDLYEEFFGSGLAHQTLALERLNHVSGRFVDPAVATDLPIQLGVIAHLTRDGRYQWLDEKIPYATSEPFQGRYVADVHRYQAGKEIPEKKPGLDWAGIKVAPQPYLKDQTETLNHTRFPLLSMRGGFDPDDDYLAVAGFNRAVPSGALVCLETHGVSVLGSGTGDSRSASNGASAVRLSGYQIHRTKVEEGKSPCTLHWKAELPGQWAFEIKTEISPDMEWTRDVIRLANGVYVFRDTFTARRTGEYLLQVNWQPNSAVAKADDGWTLATDRGLVRIDLVGRRFSQRKAGDSLHWRSVRTMDSGDSATVWTTVQALKNGQALWTAEPQSEQQIQLTHSTTNRQVTLHQGGLVTSAGDLAADLIVADKGGVGVFGWRKTPDVSPKSFFLLRETDEGKSAPGTAPLDAATWVPAIARALAKSEAAPVRAAQESENHSAIADASEHWKTDWTYDGFLRPAEIAARSLAPGIFDFGKVRDLVEIRSVSPSHRIWKPSSVPAKVFVATPTATQAPVPDSRDWMPLEGRRVSRPGTRTGNYGESTPVDHADESLFLNGIKTRFIKAPEAAKLKFYAADEQVARHPVGLEVLRGVPGASSPLVEARSAIFPAFPRAFRDDDFFLALLHPKGGKPQAEIAVSGPVQSVLIADQDGDGEAEIFVLRADVKMDVFSLKGEPREPIDLYAQFAGFQEKYGRENTRHPAGGYDMPFAMGLWRPNAEGAQKFVISRYGSLAFLNENRHLEGLLSFPAYASPGMLPQGYDFNGDGREEMLMLERFRLVHIGGDAKPWVREPGGAQFWPQVYERLAVTSPEATETDRLSGEPIYAFEVLEQFGGKPQFAFIARSDYVGIYNAVARKWSLSWSPPAPISAASVVEETAKRLQICVATVDGLFWTVTWDVRRPSRPAVEVRPLPLFIREIQSGPSRNGMAVLAAKEGLFLRSPEGMISRIAGGSFHSAVLVSNTQVVASTERGQVKSFFQK